MITIAISIGYINQRFFKLQDTIAIMSGSLLLSLFLIILHHLGYTTFFDLTHSWLNQLNFQDLLLKGMLNFLLFAGALTIDFYTLRSQKWEIATLASISTIVSTLMIGTLAFYLLPLLNLSLPYLYCLLFGSLISPTDPIAVLTTFKKLGVSKKISMCVAGESLFNDGVGIVLFMTLFQLTFDHVAITPANIATLFCQEAIGGILYGIALGWLTYYLIRKLTTINSIVLVTIASVAGGYSLALSLNISGPLAMVASGILVGHQGRRNLSLSLFSNLDHFWEIIDELLNAILFVLIGFELLNVHTGYSGIIAGLIAIPTVLAVRLITISIPMKLLQFKNQHEPKIITILTWGGLRGGLAVALALSLPDSTYRDLILTLTYSIVTFAIVVQGITIQYIVKSPEKGN